jgi:hypothetical protein
LSCATGHDRHGSGALRPGGGGNASGGSTGEVPLPLVRISGILMRASTIPIAISIALVPLPAFSFDQEEFCIAVTDIARRMNARKGRWLDRSTRHDGVELDCESKTLEAKRFVDADPDEMREGWEASKQREWNTRYCNDESWREAIENGWSIISTITFRTGDELSFAAAC